jgi:hypothetical protein
MTKRFMVPPITKLYAVALLVLNPASCASRPPMQHHMMMMSDRATAFTQTMRRLWAEEVVLQRRFVESGSQVVRTRLLAKQDEIGAAIAPYHGAETADKVAALLKDFMITGAHADAVEIASRLHQPELASMLDRLASMKELAPAFDEGMMIADTMANAIIMRFPDRF